MGHKTSCLLIKNRRWQSGKTKLPTPVSRSWYSYDERGRVGGMVQDVTGIGDKTVTYRYNSQGSVMTVSYQKGHKDAFFHYYTYDQDGRLEQVYTSTKSAQLDAQLNLTNLAADYKLQASYEYYLHGPLKKVVLVDGLQETDYTYTVQGWLKAINNPNDTSSPDTDVFAMQLDYFSGDYVKQGSSIRDIDRYSSTEYPEQFSGLIRSQSWCLVDADQPWQQVGSYVYGYDARYQLEAATYGSADFGQSRFAGAADQAYSVSGLTYDANGNLKSLLRRGEKGSLLHHFTCDAEKNLAQQELNRLGKVRDQVRGDAYTDYGYNAIGQLIEETKESTSRVFLSN